MSVAVVQPLPGIGDMIWHLPHIAAVATWAGEPVTLLAKPRSLADQICADDPAVRDVMWVDLNPSGQRGVHDGPMGLLRLAAALRARRFRSIILLHHSHRIAAAALLAGIPERCGYGWGGQRYFLNRGPYLPADVARMHQHTRATRFLAAAGIPLPATEPRFIVPPAALEYVWDHLGARRYVAMGIGSSETSRQFGARRFAEVAAALLRAGWPAIALLGGPGEIALAAAVQAELGDLAERTIPVLGWHLQRTAAVLSEAAFYVGNDTGVMNLAAAVGIRTYALFGTTPAIRHASQIVPITSPPGGPVDGMARLTTAAVLAAITADRGGLGPL
jgi:heptosyltransferase-2